LEQLRRELTQVLGTAVDVVPSDSLRARVRREVERDAVTL
jgi:predicted nucleotidyltransferase